MKKSDQQLAEQAGFVLDELPDTVLQPLTAFADLLRTQVTQEVVKLCANTINQNLLEQKRRARNRLEFFEFCVIILVLVVWGAWWYTQLHT